MLNDIWSAIVKMAVDQARHITDDQEALFVKCLFKQWDQQIGKILNAGEYVQHNDKLYRVLQAHTAQLSWEPGIGTESLYVVIDKKHEGTLDDPIPYNGNMELLNGKFYVQDEILYFCNRDSGIAIHHKLKDLVGVYVDLVETEEKIEGIGGKEDPIEYAVGTEITKDKYYVEDGILYLCILSSGIPLHHKLANLVGLYVQVV